MKRLLLCIIISISYFHLLAQESDLQIEKRRHDFIYDFISTYKAAYEKKQIDYISAFFSTDALIITETKELLKKGEELTPKSTKKRPYKLIIEDKKQYINRLCGIFNSNIKIQLSLSNLKIMKHPKYKEIYGVGFTQMWTSQESCNNLEDDMLGYVFLLIDFKGLENNPIIYVRTWQPNSNIKKPTDKYTIIDFHIYESQ